MNIETKNKKFNAMPTAKKRVAIAKDVLLQLEKRKIKVESGTFVEVRDKSGWYISGDINQDLLLTKGVNCTVCALGALAVSRVTQGNKATLLDNRHNMYHSLKGIFSETQLRDIESAFEGSVLTMAMNHPRLDLIEIFEKEYTTDKTRIREIMKNIIRNKGTFVLADYKKK